MEDSKHASRKFLLFAITTLVFLGGWVYALIYKPDLLTGIMVAIFTVISGYSGANLLDNGTVTNILGALKNKIPETKSLTEDTIPTIILPTKTVEKPPVP